MRARPPGAHSPRRRCGTFVGADRRTRRARRHRGRTVGLRRDRPEGRPLALIRLPDALPLFVRRLLLTRKLGARDWDLSSADAGTVTDCPEHALSHGTWRGGAHDESLSLAAHSLEVVLTPCSACLLTVLCLLPAFSHRLGYCTYPSHRLSCVRYFHRHIA